MKSRLIRFSGLESAMIVALLVTLPSLLMPTMAAAQTDTKPLVLEIKNFNNFSIPSVTDISDYLNQELQDEPVVTVIQIEEPKVEAIKSQPAAVKPITQNSTVYPPRVTGDERVYMHEPEIRDYLCPKMGNEKCNIFIAILKAENGTHECTRDNRGVNKNGSIDVGLAQINWNPKWNPPYTIEPLRDCKFNLDIALKKYEARGFQPWYAYTKGAYKKFLKPVKAPEVSVLNVQ
jgi:hypothetical protein